MKITSRCIACSACIENCPICYCVEYSTTKPHLVTPGHQPPDFMFHNSCVNCGQCQKLSMKIPNALFMHAQQVELQKMFGHVSGYDEELLVLGFAEEAQNLCI